VCTTAPGSPFSYYSFCFYLAMHLHLRNKPDKQYRGRGCGSVVEHLPSVSKALGCTTKIEKNTKLQTQKNAKEPCQSNVRKMFAELWGAQQWGLTSSGFEEPLDGAMCGVTQFPRLLCLNCCSTPVCTEGCYIVWPSLGFNASFTH
jgi:hypothetical protein